MRAAFLTFLTRLLCFFGLIFIFFGVSVFNFFFAFASLWPTSTRAARLTLARFFAAFLVFFAFLGFFLWPTMGGLFLAHFRNWAFLPPFFFLPFFFLGVIFFSAFIALPSCAPMPRAALTVFSRTEWTFLRTTFFFFGFFTFFFGAALRLRSFASRC